VYVVYDSISEFVFSVVDIFLAILIMYVVTRTNRKGTKDDTIYAKMKAKAFRFIVAWILVSGMGRKLHKVLK
jgi:hypothetical protein